MQSGGSRSRSPSTSRRVVFNQDYQTMPAYAIPITKTGKDVLLANGGFLLKKARARYARVNICLNIADQELVFAGRNVEDVRSSMKYIYKCMESYGKYSSVT